MIKFIEKLKLKIINKLDVKNVLIIDDSHKHKKHKSYDPKKYHLKLILESPSLKNMSKIDSSRIIFSILKEELKNKIHALQIEIK